MQWNAEAHEIAWFSLKSWFAWNSWNAQDFMKMHENHEMHDFIKMLCFDEMHENHEMMSYSTCFDEIVLKVQWNPRNAVTIILC